jgi:hypothetical protein
MQNYVNVDFEKALEDMRKDLEKKYSDLCAQTKVSSDDFQKAITSAMDAAIQKFNLSTNQVIEIRSIDNNNVFYRTTITLNQSITNDWPQTRQAQMIYTGKHIKNWLTLL